MVHTLHFEEAGLTKVDIFSYTLSTNRSDLSHFVPRVSYILFGLLLC